MRSLGLRLTGALALLHLSLCGQNLAEDDPGDFVRQGRILSQQGKQQDALQMYRNALQLAPESWSANQAAGVSLDLTGAYSEAREHFARAIRNAPAQSKIRALRDMAVSYAFENKCAEAGKYEQQAFDLALAAKDFYAAGEIANEQGRICIEAGDLAEAARWYRLGYETGIKEPDIKPDRRNLWDFRWEHAQGRLAARRGTAGEAQKHVAAAKSILAKGDNPQQEQFMPYLTGYVAFYLGDYKSALDRLQQANQNDPFILSMIARAYEKLGNPERASEYYSRALNFQMHNPTVAFSRPLALKKLGR